MLAFLPLLCSCALKSRIQVKHTAQCTKTTLRRLQSRNAQFKEAKERERGLQSRRLSFDVRNLMFSHTLSAALCLYLSRELRSVSRQFCPSGTFCRCLPFSPPASFRYFDDSASFLFFSTLPSLLSLPSLPSLPISLSLPPPLSFTPRRPYQRTAAGRRSGTPSRGRSRCRRRRAGGSASARTRSS